MNVDPKTNYLYIADGYGNRRMLIVDAATGKYIGHFGAYGAESRRRRPRRIGRTGEGVGTLGRRFCQGAA